MGAPEAEQWVKSEIEDDIPQVVRYLVLRRLWSTAINPYRDHLEWIDRLIQEAEQDPQGQFADAGIALKRLKDAGVDFQDIGRVARLVVYEAVFGVLTILDEGYDPELDEDGPGWALVELDTEGEMTGRFVAGLHESLLSIDPSGNEGRPT